MNHLSSNIKVLRKRHNLSQSSFAEKVNVSRANVAKYEGAIHEPSIDVLIKISRYFNVSLDTFITTDMSKLDDKKFEALRIDGKMVFPIQVDHNGDDVIEVVPHNAQAGYTGMYGDAGFIESLDHLNLPILPSNGKCRAFPVSGDSMPPYGEGSYVIGEYVEGRNQVKPGERYVLLSRDEGIVFKRVEIKTDDKNVLILHSDNPKYDPFEIQWSEVIEIWKFVAAITMNELDTNSELTNMMIRIEELQSDLKVFSERFSLNN